MDTQASYIIGIFLIVLGIIWAVTQEIQAFHPRREDHPWRSNRSQVSVGYTNRRGDQIASTSGRSVIFLGIAMIVMGFLLIIFPYVLPRVYALAEGFVNSLIEASKNSSSG